MRRFLLSLVAAFAATCTVMADDVTVTFDFTSADELTALGITIPEEGKGTNIEAALVKDGVTIANANAEGVNATRIWSSTAKDAPGSLDLRIYAGSKLTISCPTDKVVKTMTWTSGNKAEFTCNSGEATSIAWTGSAASVELTSTATSRINVLTVIYGDEEQEGDDDTTVKTATFDFTVAATEWNLEAPESGQGTSVNGLTLTAEDASISFEDGEAGTTCRYFLATNGKYNIRTYAGSTTTFSVAEGYVIKEIAFTSGNAQNMADAENVWSAGNFDATLVWTPEEGTSISSVSLEAGKTLQFNTVTVKYVPVDSPTAIESVKTAVVAPVFNLAGQRVARPAGIVIKDGRKQIAL